MREHEGVGAPQTAQCVVLGGRSLRPHRAAGLRRCCDAALSWFTKCPCVHCVHAPILFLRSPVGWSSSRGVACDAFRCGCIPTNRFASAVALSLQGQGGGAGCIGLPNWHGFACVCDAPARPWEEGRLGDMHIELDTGWMGERGPWSLRGFKQGLMLAG